MKKIIILTIAIVAALGLTTAVAGTGSSIHGLITDQIKMPAELKGQKLNEKVNVQFKIEQDGNASIVEIKTSNEELKKDVIRQFKKINFSNVADRQGIVYSIDISFKVL